jgi:putative heme-binding domain-containing protein
VNVRSLGAKALQARGAAAIPAVEALLADENPYIRARAVWLLARLGPDGVARAAKLLTSPEADLRVAAYRAMRLAGTNMTYAGSMASDASPAVRREVALSLRDVPFEQSGHILTQLAKGYDGKDRSYLEAWGIGATGKEPDLYAALAATQRERDASKWPTSYSDLVWRLTPTAAVDALAQRAKAASLPAGERTKAITALGFIASSQSASALLDIAQSGGGDLRTNPALWWLLNYKDSRWADAGVDAELKKRGLFDPDKVEINAVEVPEAPATALDVAAIAKLRGNAKKGATAAAACQMCHRINGQGTDYAPDLSGFASRQTRDVVIGAIVNPSSDIAHGYDGTQVTLTDGRKIHGLVLSGGNPLIIQSTGGVTQMIPAAMVKERKRLGRSLMLSADQLGLTAQQVADVVAYLK